MRQHRDHCQLAERVAATVAAIQLRRLQARPRNAEGAAIKERQRLAPGLPWRLRAGGSKRRQQQPAATAEAALAGQPACRAADLLQMKPGAWPSGEVVRAAVLEDAAAAEGVHDLRPPGPCEGSLCAVNGRLPVLWSCWTCGKKGHISTECWHAAGKGKGKSTPTGGQKGKS